MIFSFLQGDSKQLVLPLSCLDIVSHIVCIVAKLLTLVFQVFDLLVIFVLDLAQVLEFVLVPFELLLEIYDTDILCQFLVLLLRFRLQKGKFLFNFVHVGLKSKPEIILVLSKDSDKLFIIVFK